MVLELKVTTELAVNPVPFNKSVNAGPPAVVLAGTSPPTTGWVFVGKTDSGSADVVPPPNKFTVGSVTEMLIVLWLAISLAVTGTVSCVLLTNVVD
jgi:hypothetical protein